MEIFAHLSPHEPHEMEEATKKLRELLGDDAKSHAAIERFLEETPKLTAQLIHSSLKGMSEEADNAVATEEALVLLGSDTRLKLWKKRSEIMEEVMSSGKMSAEHAERFRSNPKAWDEELKLILDQLEDMSSLLLTKPAETEVEKSEL